MERKIRPIPEGYQRMTPYFTVQNAAQAIDFYKEAFGAQERYRMVAPDGKSIAHAELRIGDSVFMVSDEMPGQSCEPAAVGEACNGFYLYVEDVDDIFEKAVAAGGKVKEPLKDAFWGDRIGKIVDPAGQEWILAAHVEDVSPEEIRRRGEKEFKNMYQESGRR